jgi:hypothetical protein
VLQAEPGDGVEHPLIETMTDDAYQLGTQAGRRRVIAELAGRWCGRRCRGSAADSRPGDCIGESFRVSRELILDAMECGIQSDLHSGDASCALVKCQ